MTDSPMARLAVDGAHDQGVAAVGQLEEGGHEVL
jgi:hypothetical protein